MRKQTFVLCDNLVKIFKFNELEVVALQGLDLEVAQGEVMALVGPSGSGKSTLLNIIGSLDSPSAGGVWVGGVDLLRMGRKEQEKYKRTSVGFLWQQPARNLLPYLSALENVELPMLLAGTSAGERRKRALELLDMIGLADRARFHPDRLSGGQQQRVALAVALANRPPLLLVDEPTGQIDSFSANQVYKALRRFSRAYNTTILIVTHDPRVASWVDRVVAISDGRTSTEIRRRNAQGDAIQEEEWVLLDQVGRLQLPKPFVHSLKMSERVKVRLEPDHVSVWPGQSRSSAEQPPQQPAPAKRQMDHISRSRPVKPSGPAVVAVGLSRTYDLGAEKVRAIHNLDLTIPSGALCAVTGRSGSGKTTLLNLVAGLDEPTSGSVSVFGQSLGAMSARQKTELRRRAIGFVHQTLSLLPYLSVEENVEVPLRLQRLARKERRLRVAQALELVGLSARARHRSHELSGGEQQRAAIARALVSQPALILADEPTGQLDTLAGAGIIALFREIITRTGVTILIASHDPNLIKSTDWVYELSDGRLAASYSPGQGHINGSPALQAQVVTQ
ncbi:MAG: ABC transporter ATP-binding protein [Anaerolineales bacterium]|nr:ABC transporter ATP-binding protein [Anaerolineales bacterium]